MPRTEIGSQEAGTYVNGIVFAGYDLQCPSNAPQVRMPAEKWRVGIFRPLTQKGANHMLVLSRQRDETIMIGDDIEVTVVDIRGDKVRLGINAPKEISVHRKEVYDAIRRENRAAAQVKPEDLSGLGKISPPGPGKEQGK
jgi:carbon storage regulator